MGRPPTYSIEDKKWILSQTGSNKAVYELAQHEERTNLTPSIIKRLRASASSDMGPEIVALTSNPPVDPCLTAGSQTRKRKRDHDPAGSQTIGSDSEDDTFAATERDQKSLWIEEIHKAMEELCSCVTNMELKSPEEVDCAEPLNEQDCGVHTVVNLIYKILNIPPPMYIDSWWRSTLICIWDRQYESDSRLRHEFPAIAVDCENNGLFSNGVLAQCPEARSLLEEQLTVARTAARNGLDDWLASCKCYTEEMRRLKKYQEMQETSQNEVKEKSELLAKMNEIVRMARTLGTHRHVVDETSTNEIVLMLSRAIASAKGAVEESDKQITKERDRMSRHEGEWTGFQTKVGQRLLRLDKVMKVILELSKTKSVEGTPLVMHNCLTPEQSIQLPPVVEALRTAMGIITLVGAGISTSAGIPDFRSSDGLFETLKVKYGLKGSGQDLFRKTVYQAKNTTAAFHDMIRNLSTLAQEAEPTPFHRMLEILANRKQLLHLISQNIDGLDTRIPSLATKTPLTPPYPITLQLHGSIGTMTCTSCHRIAKLDPGLFSGSSKPPCENCSNQKNGRRRAAGGMRPRMTLYGERPADDLLGEAINLVLEEERCDLFMVVGTALEISNVLDIVRQMRRRVKKMVWINKDPPPEKEGVTWDHIYQGGCDDVARQVMKDLASRKVSR